MDYVEIDRSHERTAIVVMNRPERLNAIGADMVTDLKAAFADLHRDRSIATIILRGEGRSFCSGADLSGDGGDAPDIEGRSRLGLVYRSQQHLAELMLAIHECEKPVIAAVHGAAVGGGLALALASDLRVASADAKFGAVFIRVGLTSCDVGTSYFLPRIVGPTIAGELMLTGRHFTAEEANRYGMLNRLVESPADVLSAALDLANLIAQNSEYGIWLTKDGMWLNMDAPSFRHALAIENRQQVLGTFTDNMTEASAAFRERRDPIWKPL